MSCEIPSTFHNVQSLNDTFYISCVEENIKSFLDYGFLNIGGFINVNIPTSGLYSNNFHVLKNTTDPGYTGNKVWQTPKKNWVWESGISYNGSSPINISGVIVNGTNYPAPTGSGGVTYSLDYENGRVIFNPSVTITTNTNVQMAYSYRWCQVLKASDNNGWQYLQQLSYQPNSSINTNNKGDNAIMANHRLQMPAIVIETTSKNNDIPYELGSLVSYRQQDILLHVYTENINDLNSIMDIIRYQKEKMVQLYDIKKVVNSGVYGINANGSKNSSGLNYHQLINNPTYSWNKMYIKDVSFLDIQKNNISNSFWCIIRLTSEIIL